MNGTRTAPPGTIRDAIIEYLGDRRGWVSPAQVVSGIAPILGAKPAPSSVRSYLSNNAGDLLERGGRGEYRLRVKRRDVPEAEPTRCFPEARIGKCRMVHADCIEWLADQPDCSIHAVVTDPPYGPTEYSAKQQKKLRSRSGGVWRIPPAFDGVQRAPVPRFTVAKPEELYEFRRFTSQWAEALLRVLVPGANVIVASNPLLSYIVAGALVESGFERRGEIIRLVMTMRGGDRPKGAHDEFDGVSVMPRSMWEPWLVFRKRPEGTIRDNLRKWGAGGFRRPSADKPFGDVIRCAPTRKIERELAPHPSLKPQRFLRQIVRGVLPLGEGVIYDPFAGSGSTLAAASAIGYKSIGTEKDPNYYALARDSIPRLTSLETQPSSLYTQH